MKTTCYRALMLVLTIFVLILSLFNTGAVFADEGVPPTEPVATEEPIVMDQSTEEPIATDVPVATPEPTSTVEPVGTDVPAATADPISTQEPVAVEENSVQEVLAQIPTGTDVIVLNENGQLEPLVSQEAENTILASDPMWCPTGQIPGDAGCTAGYSTAAELITALNGVTGDGIIYFTSTYSTNDLTFDHTNANLSGLGALTIQGGWNGSTGNAFNLFGSTTFTGVELTITNWTSAVTINNIIVEGAGGGVVGSGAGISVETTDDIILNDVQSYNNLQGANLDNRTGGGSVTLNGTNIFNNNGDAGLEVLSNSDVTLNGTNTFNNNGYTGLHIHVSGDGNITANNITANGNVYGNGGAVLINDGSGSVSITGTNTFNDNIDSAGLYVWANGDISLNNVTANNNSREGLLIYSNGNVSISNVTANDNTWDGVYLINCIWNGSNCIGSGNVTLTGENTFNNNGSNGLYTEANGNITINNVIATNNVSNGLVLGNTNGNITINCGTISGNGDYGILGFRIPSGAGNLTLNGVTMSENITGDVHQIGGGTIVNNPFDCSPGKPVVNHPSRPINIVNVTSGQSVELACELFAGTVLILPNGDKVTFRCPIKGSGTLNILASDGLPGALPEGLEYVSGMQSVQSPDGSDKALSGLVITSFVIPEEMKSENLAILYWNGSEWLDLHEATFEDGRAVIDGGYFTLDGYFEAFTNYSGNFVLVKK